MNFNFVFHLPNKIYLESTTNVGMYVVKIVIQVALTLHGFTLHDPHFTRGLYFFQMDSYYVMHYTISSLYTVKKTYLSCI